MRELKLLASGYKNDESLYNDFIENNIYMDNDYFSKETVLVKEMPNFPIYINTRSSEVREKQFTIAFDVLSRSYLDLEGDLLFDEKFWHTYLIIFKRDYIIENYPQVADSYRDFKNIVIKNFDWENYIYKCVFGANYINDNIESKAERQRYFSLIIKNLDIYNYIIKYPILRNEKFLINVLDIIEELDLSEVLKEKIKGREDLGDDERYGRRVIFELNKSYPVIMSPLLDKEELKGYFLEYLGYYYDHKLNTDNKSQIVAESMRLFSK